MIYSPQTDALLFMDHLWLASNFVFGFCIELHSKLRWMEVTDHRSLERLWSLAQRKNKISFPLASQSNWAPIRIEWLTESCRKKKSNRILESIWCRTVETSQFIRSVHQPWHFSSDKSVVFLDKFVHRNITIYYINECNLFLLPVVVVFCDFTLE